MKTDIRSTVECEVVVGNVGMVYRGLQFRANMYFDIYVDLSKKDCGRSAGEPVYLFRDGEIVREYDGAVDNW